MMSRMHLLADDTEDEVESACCKNLERVFMQHPCTKGALFISLFTLCLSESITDWLLYQDVSTLEYGLVYGPLEPMLTFILLIFCAVGSILYLFEVSNLIRDTCAGVPWVNPELAAALSVWLDDLPIIAVNVIISLCHSEPISFYQLTKACLSILCVFLRLISPVVRAFILKTEKPHVTGEKFRSIIYRAVTTFGVCLLLCGSVTIFIFTHIIAKDDGKLQFRLPQHIWEGKFANDKYFKDVGIYFLHSEMKLKLEKDTEPREYWIKLASILEFHPTAGSMNVKLSYTEAGGFIQKMTVRSFNKTGIRFHECYFLQRNTSQLHIYQYTNCSRDFILKSEGPKELVFRFVYTRPKQHLLLGDITFNLKYLYGSVCHQVLSAVNTTDIYLYDDYLGDLHYMKHETQAHENHRLVQRTSNQTATGTSLQFSTHHFLWQAEDFWKTGFIGCKCTGRIGPTFNKSLAVAC